MMTHLNAGISRDLIPILHVSRQRLARPCTLRDIKGANERGREKKKERVYTRVRFTPLANPPSRGGGGTTRTCTSLVAWCNFLMCNTHMYPHISPRMQCTFQFSWSLLFMAIYQRSTCRLPCHHQCHVPARLPCLRFCLAPSSHRPWQCHRLSKYTYMCEREVREWVYLK